MRIGLLGNPDSVGIADTGNVSDRTSKVGIVELKNISSNVLGLIGDKDNYKIRTRRSGISRQEDNATKQAYSDDLINIELTNYIHYLTDSTSDANDGRQQGVDISWDGRKIYVSFGKFDDPFVEWQDQLADKSLTRTADISSSGNYKETGDYDYPDTQDEKTLAWHQVYDETWQSKTSYYPQIKSIAWSRDGLYLLGGGYTKKHRTHQGFSYNWITWTLWSWTQMDSSKPWDHSQIGGRWSPGDPGHTTLNGGEEPYWCQDNYETACSGDGWITGNYPSADAREWAQDVSWNDDGTKLFYLEYTYDDDLVPNITKSIIRECAPTLRGVDNSGYQTLSPNPYKLGDDTYGAGKYGTPENLAKTRAVFSQEIGWYNGMASCDDKEWGGVTPAQFGPTGAVNVGYPYYSNSWNYIGILWDYATTGAIILSFCFSRDGKKLYVLYMDGSNHIVVCYKLKNPFDLLDHFGAIYNINLGTLITTGTSITNFMRKKIRIWKNADILWLFATTNGTNEVKHYQFQQKLY